MKGKTKGGIAGLLMGCMGGSVWGAGFQLYTEGSAEALGQAGAISGRTNLTSLAWYNPSALAGARQPAVMAGLTLVQIRTDFESALNPALDTEMADDWRPIPHVYVVRPLAQDWTAMLSVNAPYGLITEWPDDWAGSPAATYSELATLYTTPSIAWRVNKQLSLSAGFNVVYSEAELSANRGTLGERTIEGDDIAFGYTASGHIQSGDWGLGLRFQSRVRIEPEGEITYENDPGFGRRFDAEGRADLPASVNFGIANHSIDNLHLGFDVVWSEWSAYDELVFIFPDNPYEPGPEATPKRWDDVFSFRLGAEYAVSDRWVARAGYVYDESPVNDLTRAPELPGSDRHMVMAGLGWTWNQLTIDAAYSFLWAEKTSTGDGVVNANPPATLGTAGDYETITHLVALSAGYRF